MKTSIWIGGVAAVALAASAGIVAAQQAPAQDPVRQDRGMARADADGDGRISREEFQRYESMLGGMGMGTGTGADTGMDTAPADGM